MPQESSLCGLQVRGLRGEIGIIEHFLPVRTAFIDGIELDPIVLKDVISEQVHPLGEVFVEDEAEDVVSKLIRPHLSPQGVGDVLELGLESFLVVFGHSLGTVDDFERERSIVLVVRDDILMRDVWGIT